MPRKRVNRSPPIEKRSEDADDDDFFFDDTQSNSGRSSQEPQHRNAANARERARMRVLSKAFCRLKTTLPWVPADTKLSKLDTLRLAASYIAHLRALLHEPRSAHTPPHPLSLVRCKVVKVERDPLCKQLELSCSHAHEKDFACGGIVWRVALFPQKWLRRAMAGTCVILVVCLMAWPFAFQHGGALSCSISQRWNITPQNNDTLSCRNNVTRENSQNIHEYPQEYPETDYDERSYDERGYDDMATNECTQMQYCNYGYKENYYEMRNGYSTENLLNNVG